MQNMIPHLTYRQFQRVQGLAHQCRNNDAGNCLLLENGWETCVFVQSISQSLICKCFRAAVLPLDRGLETALLYKNKSKRYCQLPTGENTAPTAPLLFTASRRPNANGGEGPSVDN